MNQEFQDVLDQRLNFLSSRILEMEESRQRSEAKGNSMRIRVKATATKNGFSVEATLDNTELVDPEWAERLEAQALDRLASVMANLNTKFPREA